MRVHPASPVIVAAGDGLPKKLSTSLRAQVIATGVYTRGVLCNMICAIHFRVRNTLLAASPIGKGPPSGKMQQAVAAQFQTSLCIDGGNR